MLHHWVIGASILKDKCLDHQGSREFILEFKTLEDEGAVALQISGADYPAKLNHTIVEASQPGIVSTNNTVIYQFLP